MSNNKAKVPEGFAACEHFHKEKKYIFIESTVISLVTQTW